MTVDLVAEQSLTELSELVRDDPFLAATAEGLRTLGVEHWLSSKEQAALFAMGRSAPPGGRIVEIGSWHGASASMIAAGLVGRDGASLTCVDPHLGGPPWLGMSPPQRTLDRFNAVTLGLGVSEWIDVRVGASEAVAATWAAEPLHAVFIDGDHSFVGVIGDVECWAPKLSPGGLMLIDDADDPALPELLDALELLKGLPGVRYVETLDGFAVFRRDELSAREMLNRLSSLLAQRGIRRAWDMSCLHTTALPENYGASRTWNDHGLDVAYQLCYLARCGPGAYGYAQDSSDEDRAILHALSADRHDGAVLPAEGISGPCRAILCPPESAAALAPALLTGGVLIARDPGGADKPLPTRRRLLEAGLEGCGWHEDIHWGVWRPAHLSGQAILHYAFDEAVES
jgi:predicted O-methyltransferase YrrM